MGPLIGLCTFLPRSGLKLTDRVTNIICLDLKIVRPHDAPVFYVGSSAIQPCADWMSTCLAVGGSYGTPVCMNIHGLGDRSLTSAPFNVLARRSWTIQTLDL